MKTKITALILTILFSSGIFGETVSVLPQDSLINAVQALSIAGSTGSGIKTIKDEDKFNDEIMSVLQNYDEENAFSKIVIDVDNNTIQKNNEDAESLEKYDIDYSTLEAPEPLIPAVPVLEAMGKDAELDEKSGEVVVTENGDEERYCFAENKDYKQSDDAYVTYDNGVQKINDNNTQLINTVGYLDIEEAENEFCLESEYKDGKIIITNPYQTKRLIVQSKNGKSISTNGAVKCITNGKGYYILQFKTQQQAKKAFEKLNKDKNIDYVHCDEVLQVSALSDRTGAETIQSDRYKKYLKDNKKTDTVKVAVIDTGTDTTHPFLKGRVYAGYNVYTKKKSQKDGHGHGTHVAGIVADNSPSNVKILPVKVMKDDGTGTILAIKSGIDYAVKQGVKVINLSLGGTCVGDDCPIAKSVKSAIKKGVTVVVAAGNDTDDTKNTCPANITSCITVASCTADAGTISGFSNYGSAVDLTAPGTNILSCVPGNSYQYMDGTSMAAPFVSAAAAMLIANNKSLKPSGVEKKLKSMCTDMLIKGNDKFSGSGVINFGLLFGDKIFGDNLFLNSNDSNLSLIYFSKASPYMAIPEVCFSDDFNGRILSDRSFTAKSSDSSVAIYNGRYVVPKGAGKCVITFSIPSGDKVTCSVTVKKKAVWIDSAAKSYAGGNGTKSKPYLIKTPQQLAKFALDVRNGKNFKGKYFKLVNDIDLKGKYWISASPMVSIGDFFQRNVNEIYFSGTFDGNYHKIKNMKVFDEENKEAWEDVNPINQKWYDSNGGFLGSIAGATIKNLGLDNAYCVNEGSGILAEIVYQNSKIYNCYTSGFTFGSGLACMIINYNIDIANCFSSATVAHCGIASMISSSMSDGNVKLRNVFFCGEKLDNENLHDSTGFAYAIDSIKGYGHTKIYNCFSTVQSPRSVGFTNNNNYSTISKCYYSNKNAYSIKSNNSKSKTSIAGKSDSFFKSKNSYTKKSNWNKSYPWNFSSVWAISSKVNNGYPYLKKMKPSAQKKTTTNTWLDYAADSFAGGNGTKSKPYLISNAKQLARVAKLYRYGGGYGEYFKLTKNIDLSAHNWYPIGGGTNITTAYSDDKGRYVFSGNIDGNGKTISNLKINSKANYLGFISIYRDGVIKNLKFSKADIKAGNEAGIICAENSFYGIIADCSVSGKISSKEPGSICSKNIETAKIINCKSSVGVSGTQYSGGICSGNKGTIEKTSFTGTLTAPSDKKGGIAYISKGIINNSYSLCSAPLVNYESCDQIKYCYAITDNKTAELYGNHTMAYKNDKKSIPVADLKKKSTFNGWNFEKIWSIDSKTNKGYPNLSKVTAYKASSLPSAKWINHSAKSFAGGKGTKSEPYLIANAQQLVYMLDRIDSNKSHYYRLIRNIDLGGKLWPSENNGGYPDVCFYLDGNNKTISNMTTKNGAALFAFCNNGYIKNLNLTNIKGHSSSALLAMNMGTVSNCSVSSTISSSYFDRDSFYTGGLVSVNYGLIEKCSFKGTIYGSKRTGGISGYSTGTIRNCYTSGTIISPEASAIASSDEEGNFQNCYSTAIKIGTYPYISSYNKNYILAPEYDETDGGRTSAQLKDKNTYEGWNFKTIWDINPSKNNGYPYLRRPVSRKITYYAGIGKCSAATEYDYIPTIERTLAKPKATYGIFDGWYTDKKFKNKITKVGKTDKGNITVYAKWLPAYRVCFYPNFKSSAVKYQTVARGKSTALSANTFKRKGYKFVGWAKSPKSKVVYKNKAKVKNIAAKGKDIKLYAIWKKV